MRRPVVAVGDGALGFWAAVRDVWPKTREQRDWFHKLGNILDKLPKRLQPRVKAALCEVMYAETREQAREAVTRFATEYGAKYPKAVTTLEKGHMLQTIAYLLVVGRAADARRRWISGDGRRRRSTPQAGTTRELPENATIQLARD
jgi:hypothetical protein